MRNETESESDLEQLKSAQEKNSYLFHTLTQAYSKIYYFDRSLLGRVYWFLEKLYLTIRLKPRARTGIRLLVEQAEQHSATHNIDYSEFEGSKGRLRLVLDILLYVVRHPYSSIRLINIYRIKKLLRIVLSGDSATANTWVGSRFPTDDSVCSKPIIFSISSALNDLTLDFECHEHPLVSIVVPVYNQYETTVSCLQAVLEHSHGISYEVIVADDCSTDQTQTIKERISNIVVVREAENQGFLKNCNNAVKYAKGKYVVLLNNDTNVQPNWLTHLVDVMELDNRVGLVGPKLLFDDGVLQEAGGIVWKDASGWNYGRGENPEAAEFNYLKECDYISGACVLFRKNVWDQMGGFDELFCPAYYEDTDLAFQMREAGLKVVYQPESVVVHFEGVSNGSDLNSGIKKHQRINQDKFYKKWKKTLKKEHFEIAQNVFCARERTSKQTTVVFVDHYVPFYDKDAGSRSTFIYVQSMLAMGINVKFLGANFFPHQPYTQTLQKMGVEVIYGERYARNWKTWFKEHCESIDVIYLHRPHITEEFVDYFATLEPRPKLIYFGHDLHYLRTERESKTTGDDSLLESAKDWKRRELAIFDKVDKVYYPSQVEVDEVLVISPSTNVAAIPLYVINAPDRGGYNHEERSGLLFVGGFGHPPNADAVKWFVAEVMPLVSEQAPGLCLHVVGSSVPDDVKALAGNDVIIHGFLSDEELTSLYSKVKICVVPLRYGAGVKGKVLEALQAGLPIATTSIGAEGLPEAGSVMLIANSAEDMAQNVLDLNSDKTLVEDYLSKYPSYIEQNFSKRVVEKVIKEDFLR